MDWLSRQNLLIGEENTKKLKEASVAVLGLGGVGGAVCEGLCRCGVGKLILVDSDVVSDTNRNRQLIACIDSVGQKKTDAWKRRLSSINPDCEIVTKDVFLSEETADRLWEENPQYIADCIDTVTSKLWIAQEAARKKIPLLMALGTGNRLDPTAFCVGDIEETAKYGGCGLARVMRRELKKRNLFHQPVVYSRELPAKGVVSDSGRYAPGSISFCPPVAGYILAGALVKKIIWDCWK